MSSTLLANHERAAVGEIAGRPVVLHYGDAVAEHAALRTGAMLVDRSYRGRMRVSGAPAAEMVTGLVTNDVKALQVGQGQYAAALTPKGKIIADVRVFAMGGAEAEGPVPEWLLVDAPPRAAAGWAELVRKYVNPRLAPFADESESLRDVGVFGPQARHAVERATGVGAGALAALPPYAHVSAELDGALVTIARVPDLELEGFELFVPADAAPGLWRRLAEAGATPGGLTAWEIARVEAGRPEWGIDIDDATIPQEANFDDLHAISYTKGCYVGQETVARVHFRGHVNRHLRGLRFAPVGGRAGAADGAAPPELPPLGARLFDEGGRPMGDVRSAVLSPRFGPIAIGMVRREVALGDSVAVRWGADVDPAADAAPPGGDGRPEGDGGADGATPAGETRATVVALPFGR
ncbi:MAG: YgfZ/GcvT domain-containing protein [Gemmatimonadaceae bacterium]